MQKKFILGAAALLLLGLVLVYSNHFHNAFHFDDSHTVVNNIFIRDPGNIPLFFRDASTFSSLPSNQSYRPVVSASLTIDHWIGGGLDPFYFHLSTFILFALQGVMMFFIFKKILQVSSAAAAAGLTGLFTVAWYLLHPANAETINYVISRSDSLSTFFVLLAFVMYIFSPFCRKYFLYLIPVVIGSLAKVPAVLFAPLLLAYILLFEKKIGFTEIFSPANRKAFISSLRASLPAFLLGGLLYLFIRNMEPEWEAGGTSALSYFLTQPYVIFHYVLTFFFPFWLSADTDWVAFDSLLEPKAIFGFLFVLILSGICLLTSKNEKLRPVSFGIAWFFIALIPSSSIIPLSEVMNDHRIFFPYVGLALAAGWSTYLLINKLKKIFLVPAALLCMLVVSAYGYGTHERNKVWKTDESLWKDVTEKSPDNARGLMNYGLALMGKADYTGAEEYFNRALHLWPDYAYLHINMGVLKSAVNLPAEAENYFLYAIRLRSDLPESYYYFAQFLVKQNRQKEAIGLLVKAIELAPAHTLARSLLMAVYFDNSEFEKLKLLAGETAAIIPGDEQARYYLEAVKGKGSKLDLLLEAVKHHATPEKYLSISLEYFNAGRYEESIRACEEALKLKPDYDLAYNNMCSAYNLLKQWDKAIEAGEKAVQINPSNQLARNNLEWARKNIGK